MRRRRFLQAAGAVAFGVSAACDEGALVGPAARRVDVVGAGGRGIADALASATATRVDALRLAGGSDLVIETATRTVAWFERSGLERWRLEGGPDGPLAGPVAVVSWGDLLAVVDRSRGVVVVLDADGRVVAELAADAPLAGPRDAVTLPSGELLVADTLGHALVAFTRDGGRRVVAEWPADGAGSLDAPAALALDGGGRVHVADIGAARIAVVDPRSGQVLDTYGEGLVAPRSVASLDGVTYVADAVAGAVFAYVDGTLVATRHARDLPGSAVPIRVRADELGVLIVTAPA